MHLCRNTAEALLWKWRCNSEVESFQVNWTVVFWDLKGKDAVVERVYEEL
jgi:hypothetical protein